MVVAEEEFALGARAGGGEESDVGGGEESDAEYERDRKIDEGGVGVSILISG
jgi:hypothetical protein